MYPAKFRSIARPVNAFQFFDDIATRELFRHPWKTQWNNVPSVNIKETENSFDIEMAAPGWQKNDFNVEMKEDVLTISAAHKTENNESTEKYSRREFSVSNFQRSFTLPENIDGEKINATYENGVLRVVLPKKEVTQENNTRRIDVA